MVSKRSKHSKTWFGMTSCDDISVTACNQSKMIIGRRYCLLEDGELGACSLCADSTLSDPDQKFSFDKTAVKGEYYKLTSN